MDGECCWHCKCLSRVKPCKRQSIIFNYEKLAGCGDDMFNDKLDVDALRREVGEWLLLSPATPITLSSYNSAHWSSLPSSLAWMRLSYVHRYIEKHLEMDPHVVVQVQGK
jgi:hypothetical protein